jgi:hypothetical protein
VEPEKTSIARQWLRKHRQAGRPAENQYSAQSSLRRSIPSSYQRGDLISKHINVLERTKIWLWVQTEPESKNDSAGEDQQQITALDHSLWIAVGHQPTRTRAIEYVSHKGTSDC